ncbi:hypothetical protein GE09DRAFT_1077057 [Coniochaeta sp. 2T2.1]|nr:hypothetical protein GE09DRAFT_1077057 [Coniochaeta sp. 2T2.1]
MQRLTSTLRLRAVRPSTLPRTALPTLPIASIRHTSTSSPKSAEGASAESGGSRSKSAAESQSQSTPAANPGAMPDSLSDGDARGRTGGGEALSSSDHAPKQPKVWNHSVSLGGEPGKGLTEEQQKEVDEHNKDFEKKHDHANVAEDDKVDKAFWGNRSGGGNQ